ncbi:hypothetical protein Cgig2_019180 [Carnegiea gigantea]|uniref:Uncharacterized protein n=1 Tax=Carnegiea gigantea TaxID=171969 RepID=A0A9Q1JYW7_9CARY|nr:hypothetical protein Cgig2_019180 [Carnegiea gigantea]
MAFPCSLSTKEMAEYIVRHFKWDQRGVAFPPSTPLKDFQALCPSYELTMAEEAAEHFELPKLPQVIFYAMLLNEAKGLGVLHGGMADYVRESFIWRWRRATRPPHPFPEDYHILSPHFSLPEAERGAADFELPEIVQATFYAMLLNEAVELAVLRGFVAEGLKSSLVGLRWLSFEAWMSCTDHELREV